MEREIENLTLRISDYQDEKVRHLEEKRRLEELVNDVRNKNTELEDTNNKLRGVRDNLREDNRRLRESIATQGHSLERLANSLSANLKSGTFAALRQANIDRAVEWEEHKDFGIVFYALAMGGEAGEALNVVKKLERERIGVRGSRSTLANLGQELADTLTYMDLLAWKAGIDLWEVTQATFNAVSEREGLKTKL